MNGYRSLILLVTFMLIVPGHGIASNLDVGTATGGVSGDGITYLFKNDFSESQLGGPPVGWNYSDDYGIVEVVEAPELPSGKAVRIKANSVAGKHAGINAPLWDPPAGDAKRIAVEHAVRWEYGRGINLYIRTSADHNLNWFITGDGEISYRGRDGDKRLVNITLGQLQPGWNRVRLVADREANEVYVYFNNMETPVIGPYHLREELDTWANTRIYISHTTYDDATSEAYYGDVKVWVLD